VAELLLHSVQSCVRLRACSFLLARSTRTSRVRGLTHASFQIPGHAPCRVRPTHCRVCRGTACRHHRAGAAWLGSVLCLRCNACGPRGLRSFRCNGDWRTRIAVGLSQSIILLYVRLVGCTLFVWTYIGYCRSIMCACVAQITHHALCTQSTAGRHPIVTAYHVVCISV